MGHNYWANSSTFSNLLRLAGVLLLALLLLALIRQCTDCRRADRVRTMVRERTGYDPSFDDGRNIPDVIPPYDDTLSLPESVMLEHLFPPIGDQGNYGTCVAWATGYNLMTALNAKKRHWSQADLAKPENQTSPADLWNALPPEGKGQNCSGSGFEQAFSIMSSQGVASMATVPYGQDFEPCGGTGIGDSANRISSFAAVRGSAGAGIPSIGQIKAYIADSIPLVAGIRCGDNFMLWSSDRTLTHETFRYTGPHALHAIALVGYNDSRHAFRLRNSWGEGKGDHGSIWVDYNLFVSELCFSIYKIEIEN